MSSPDWNNGFATRTGAVTWGSGAGGTIGGVTGANSLIGNSANDLVGLGGITALPNGAYLVKSPAWNNVGVDTASAVTFGGLTGVHGTISAANSVLGVVQSDINNESSRFTTSGALVIGRPARNMVTLFITDVTPPSFATPPNLTAVAPAGNAGTAVSYTTPTATDDIGTPSVACTPASGSVFAIGLTTVTCTATNTESLTASTSFTVTVTPGIDYMPLVPARLADTRPGLATVDGLFAGGGLRDGGSILELTVSGRGGVAANAAAVALNITVTDSIAAGFVTVYPCGAARPGESSYAAINPARILDTRDGHTTIDGLQQANGPVSAGSTTFLQVAGRAGVPGNAAAVMLNVTVTEPNARLRHRLPVRDHTANCIEPELHPRSHHRQPRHLQDRHRRQRLHLQPDRHASHSRRQRLLPRQHNVHSDQPGPTARHPSRLSNGGRPGDWCRYPSSRRRHHLARRRTRRRTRQRRHCRLERHRDRRSGNGYVAVYPCGIDPPLASNLNFTVGQTIPNAVITRIGNGGNVCIYDSQPTQLVADVNGYFP